MIERPTPELLMQLLHSLPGSPTRQGVEPIDLREVLSGLLSGFSQSMRHAGPPPGDAAPLLTQESSIGRFLDQQNPFARYEQWAAELLEQHPDNSTFRGMLAQLLQPDILEMSLGILPIGGTAGPKAFADISKRMVAGRVHPRYYTEGKGSHLLEESIKKMTPRELSQELEPFVHGLSDANSAHLYVFNRGMRELYQRAIGGDKQALDVIAEITRKKPTKEMLNRELGLYLQQETTILPNIGADMPFAGRPQFPPHSVQEALAREAGLLHPQSVIEELVGGPLKQQKSMFAAGNIVARGTTPAPFLRSIVDVPDPGQRIRTLKAQYSDDFFRGLDDNKLLLLRQSSGIKKTLLSQKLQALVTRGLGSSNAIPITEMTTNEQKVLVQLISAAWAEGKVTIETARRALLQDPRRSDMIELIQGVIEDLVELERVLGRIPGFMP